MKANELMIGDIVTFRSSLDEAAIPIRVEIVGIGYQDKGEENECLVRINNDESCDIIDIEDEVVGIPITGNLLEKSGFKPHFNGYRFKYILADDYYDISADEFSDGMWQIRYECVEMGGLPISEVIVSYVHELQHALRLCGIEKEIEL